MPGHGFLLTPSPASGRGLGNGRRRGFTHAFPATKSQSSAIAVTAIFTDMEGAFQASSPKPLRAGLRAGPFFNRLRSRLVIGAKVWARKLLFPGESRGPGVAHSERVTPGPRLSPGNKIFSNSRPRFCPYYRDWWCIPSRIDARRDRQSSRRPTGTEQWCSRRLHFLHLNYDISQLQHKWQSAT